MTTMPVSIGLGHRSMEPVIYQDLGAWCFRGLAH